MLLLVQTCSVVLYINSHAIMFLNLFFFMFSGLLPRTAGNVKPAGTF